MHSSWLNFSQGKSKIGTRIGQAATHRPHPPFSHFTGFRCNPIKLNLFNKAIIAPWGQKYLHQPLGTKAAKTRTATINPNENQKSKDILPSAPRTSTAGVCTIAELKYRIPLGTAVNNISAGLNTVNGNCARTPKAFAYPTLAPNVFAAAKVTLTNKAAPAMPYFK